MPQGQETIQIKFKAIGNKPLEKAILSLAKAQKTLEQSTKRVVVAQNEFGMRVPRNTDALGKQGKAFGKLQGIIAKYRNTLLLAAFAITGYSKTIGKLTSLYAVQELAEKKLSAALGFTSKRLLTYASAQQKVSVYGDEVTIQAMAQVAAFTKNETAIEGVASAAQDMASARGMDLITTTDLITKSIYSSTNALSRYGITIEEGLEGPERLNAILEELNEKYGGQAAAELDTYSGAVKALGNTWGDLGEGFGEILGTAIKPLIQGLASLGEFLKTINTRYLASGITALSMAALLGSARFKAFRTSIWDSVTAMNAGAVATKALAASFRLLMRATIVFAALEVVSAIFAALSGGSKKSTKDIEHTTTALTQFDKELIKVSNDYAGTSSMLANAQKQYDNNLKATRKNLENELKFQKEGLALTLVLYNKRRDMAKVSKELDKLAKEYGINNDELGRETKIREHLNSLLDGTNWRIKDLNSAKEQYKAMQIAEEQVLANLLPKYEKEVELLELKSKFSGKELEIAKLMNTIGNSNAHIRKEIVDKIIDQIDKKYELIEATEEEARVTKLASEAQKIYDQVIGKDANFSSYIKLQKELFDARVKYVDYLSSADITGMGEEEAAEYLKNMQMFRNSIKYLENSLTVLEGKGLKVIFMGDEKAILKLDKGVIKLNNSIKTELQLKKEEKKAYEDHLATMKVTDERYMSTKDAIQVLNGEITALTPKWGDYTEIVEFLNETNFDLEQSFLSQKDILEAYIVELETMLDSLKEQLETNEDLAAIYELLANLIDRLKNNVSNLSGEFSYLDQIGVNVLNGLHSAIATTLGEFDKINMITWDTFGNNVEQVMKQIAAQAIATGFFKIIAMLLNLGTGGTMGTAMLGLMGLAEAHKGGQITQGGVQGYATGGMIPMQGYAAGGGVDNVPIMAQEGEYVVNRRAVESIGVENLNRMNRTGQTGAGVNISFSGNVMSRDFIEGEAIPQIKDAIRRGADIGIS